MTQNYSYGSVWNLIKILNIEPPGDLERIKYFLELANKRIAAWSGLDIFKQLSDDMKDRIAELYAAYLYKLSTASVSGRLPEDLEYWKKEAMELLESNLLTASKPFKLLFSKDSV